MKSRHFTVDDIDVSFYVGDISDDFYKKYCHVSTIKSSKFTFYCFFGSYTSSLHIDRFKTEYDSESDRLNIVEYVGEDWERDKHSWGKMKTNVPHKIYKSHQQEYYDSLQKMSKLIDDITQYVLTFPKKKGKFEFDIPEDSLVCQELGTYIVHLNKESIENLLSNKMFSLRGGFRLLSLSAETPKSAHAMVHDGFTYVAVLTHSLELDEKVADTLIHSSYKNKYPVIFKPKKADGLYVIDANMSPEQAAVEMMPFNKYDGRYHSPQILAHRTIFPDELEIDFEYYVELKEKMANSTEDWRYTRDDREIVDEVLGKK
jgi:uncharacterized protein (DUF3820 family)